MPLTLTRIGELYSKDRHTHLTTAERDELQALHDLVGLHGELTHNIDAAFARDDMSTLDQILAMLQEARDHVVGLIHARQPKKDA